MHVPPCCEGESKTRPISFVAIIVSDLNIKLMMFEICNSLLTNNIIIAIRYCY